jgi:hypothetical protein
MELGPCALRSCVVLTISAQIKTRVSSLFVVPCALVFVYGDGTWAFGQGYPLMYGNGT